MTDFRKLEELALLTTLIVGEAESEPMLGKIAIGCVVRNRLTDDRWPDTWHDVILEEGAFDCFAADAIRPLVTTNCWNQIAWRECRFAAFGVINNYVSDVTKWATRYLHNAEAIPEWAQLLQPVAKIGSFWFYVT
jgi:spore germination cell wall hydrolase CwlJ-like protein